MELLREMMRIQHEQGCLTGETLSEIAKERGVPLFRLEELVSFYPAFRRTPPPEFHVRICRDVSCRMHDCGPCLNEIRDAVIGRNDVEVQEVSCLGRCENAPAVEINERPLGNANSLTDVKEFLCGDRPLPNTDPTTNPHTWKCDPYTTRDDSVPAQPVRTSAGQGSIPGTHLTEKRYSTVRSLAGDESRLAATCIERLQQAGLRGLGGAGFPTGRKWELVRNEQQPVKYVICNADES
ncbi:MAG: NAD(P)H-dependent oxidoreductase subunit E, partial [Planctomycetaceae bacterium]